MNIFANSRTTSTGRTQRGKSFAMFCLTGMLAVMLIGATIPEAYADNTEGKAISTKATVDYYVSATGDDTTGDGTRTKPWATLAKSAAVITGAGTGGDYNVYVMSNLTSTAGAQYYDNNVTVASDMTATGAPFTVTRGAGFNLIGTYNPAMLELRTTAALSAVLKLENITFNDAYLREGTDFNYATGTQYVQPAIIVSNAPQGTIVLDNGAELWNFGGMSAVRITSGATLEMKSGSLIADKNASATTRQVSTSATDWNANGEAAVSVSSSHLYMRQGAQIMGIANAHGIKFGGNYKCYIDGEIGNMIGNKGRDTDTPGGGRGIKSAVFFDRGLTLDPNTGTSGSAIIDRNADIHHNATKCGAVCISRSTDVFVKIYGKVNNNIGGTGSTLNLAGTNGGGLYIVAGGTIYLEDGCEIKDNRTQGATSYGGAASIQQGGSRLIMNGGTVSGNTSPAGNTPPSVNGIAINKGNAYFEMNGGTIDNGPNGVWLFNNAAETDTNGRLVLNEGTISGVSVRDTVVYGTNTANTDRNVYFGEDMSFTPTGAGYIAVGNTNKQVWPITKDFKIGNPNFANYANIRSALPQGWTMPTTDTNVIGFWVQKNKTLEFSVPKPTTGAGGASYNAALNRYFAAVQPTLANGVADNTVAVKIYPTKIDSNNRIVVTIPIGAYTNGATVALIQPTTQYGEINFQAPAVLNWDVNATAYTIPYTATYNMPAGLQTDLATGGHNNNNTTFTLTVRPDARTEPTGSLALNSDIFEIVGTPVWDSAAGEWKVQLRLKTGWESATNLESKFTFNCSLPASKFEENEFLSLTGDIVIDGNGVSYFIYGNDAKTEMKKPKGSLKITKEITGEDADPADEFHFTVTFSDGGTYEGTYSHGATDNIVSGAAGSITLKGGESIIIDGIPQGITYGVTEVEADQNGYATTTTGNTGTIGETQSVAAFINESNVKAYTVYFDLNGGEYTMGTTIPSILVPIGNNIMSESGFPPIGSVFKTADSKFTYTFKGWIVKNDKEEKEDPPIIVMGKSKPMSLVDGEYLESSDLMPANNVFLTAQWEKKQILPNSPKVSITKKADQSTVKIGDKLSYTITVTNKGNATAEDIVIKDFLPKYTTYVSSAPKGELTKDGGQDCVTWTIKSLKPNKSMKLNLVVQTNKETPKGHVFKNVAIYQDARGDESTTTSNTATTPVTGDESDMTLLLVLLIASGVLIVGTVVFTIVRKRKK